MTEKDYLLQIEYIREKIISNELYGLDEKLDELYRFKPVRLLWFITKAELLWKQGKMKESWSMIEDKVMLYSLYPGIDTYIGFHQKWIEFYNIPIESRYLDNLYSRMKGIVNKNDRLEEAFKNCINAEVQNENKCLDLLMREYIVENQILVQQMIRYQLLHSGYFQNVDRNVWYYNETNYGYLEERLLSTDQEFIIVSDGKNQRECDVLLSVLGYFNKKTFLLLDPIMVDEVNDLEESMEVSLNNVQSFEDAVSYPIIQYIDEDKIKNNRCEMIQYICKNMTKRNYAILLTSGELFLEFIKTPELQKNVECLSNMDEVNATDKMYFGWVGDYVSYISDVYNMDVYNELNANQECDFSIIIPARNSAGTLEYTLKTCLQQDYQGSYEIIVSDNSTNGKQEVYHLCKNLGDSRIKYYKTPRNLPLSKSFEYAYLKSRGKFIFAIGSDDGVCSWTLSFLDKILDKYPDEKIIQWQRGYYAWKGFDGTIEDKMVVPGRYDKDNIEVEYIDKIEYFARVLKYGQYMYSLPLLYINSGCRRSYFHTLLMETGRLWDGCNQDIYIGIMNAAINQKILNVSFPLTIAGASNNSLGYVSGLQQKDEKQEDLMKSTCLGDNIGLYVSHGIVKEIPIGTAETCSLYSNFMRAIQLGVLPDSWRNEVFDYKKIFKDHFLEHSCLDDKFDKYIHYGLYLAKNRDEEFYNWFLENIYLPEIKPRFLKDKPSNSEKVKSFKEGISESGGLIIDASKYGVVNIEEAVKLFERFVYWTPEIWNKEMEYRKA